MKLAIVTCTNLPNGVEDDLMLFDALKSLGLEITIHPWNDDISWHGFDACLLRSVWDYHENAQDFLAWLNATSKLTIFINKAEIIQWNTNKVYLRELADFGVSIAPTLWLDAQNNHDIKQLVKQFNSEQYFLKPVIGADSSGTFRFGHEPAEIAAAQLHLDNQIKNQTMMLQPYLKTVETSGETSGMFFSGNYSHAVRKIPVKGDYRVQDTFGALDESYELNAAEMALSKACLSYLQSKFGDIVYARFDFLRDSNGAIYLNEAELFEPSLFFNHDPSAGMNFAQNINQYLRQSLNG